MKFGSLAAVCLVSAMTLGSSTAFAARDHSVPAPPPPPGCKTCSGPPAPPTPVPTLAPTVVPAQPVVDVHLSAPKVSRGHKEKLQIEASSNDVVTVQVRYRTGKAKSYRTKIGDSGNGVTEWKVPRSAPIGKATIKVTVAGTQSYSKNLSFLVTK